MTVKSVSPLTGALAESFSPLVERLRRSVVAVHDADRGSGAGVVWGPNGLIITNNHVAHGENITVSLVDGRRIQAEIVARQPDVDLTALRAEIPELPIAEAGESRKLRPGQFVFAIGHPLGLENAATVGVISNAPDPNTRRSFVTANINLNRGNSGGPLADAYGRVIGINTMVATPGIGLAIPSHMVETFLARAVGPSPYIGITAQPVEGADGLLLTGVDSHGPAETAGLLPGDILLMVNAQPLHEPYDLLDEMAQAGVGGQIALTIQRAGHDLELSLRVGAKA